MNELTFYELGGEDMYITADRMAHKKEVEIKVFNEEDELVFSERSHDFAWDSYVQFAKQILRMDDKIKRQTELYYEYDQDN